MSHGRISVSATADSRAAPAEVFALLSDSSTYPQWSMIDAYHMERPGRVELHGVGEIRELRAGLFRVREEIVEQVENRLVAYVLLSGLPMRNYRGETTLEPLPGGGTRIRWQSVFDGVAGTGFIMRLLMQRALTRLSAMLAAAATTQSFASEAQQSSERGIIT